MALATRHVEFFGSHVRFFVSFGDRIFNLNSRVRGFSSNSSRWYGRDRGIAEKLLGLLTGAFVTCGSIVYLLERSVKAMGLEAKPPRYPWSMNGLISSLDHSSIRRGWHVYRSVCSTCHSLSFVHFRDLVGVSHTEEEMKAIAAEYEIEDGPNDEGNYYKRSGKLYDSIPMPFPNDEAARAANNGAVPVDLNFIINGRKSGKDYVFSLLTGYSEPPAGFELAEGQVFNAYFPGGAISMPEMIQDGIVEYDDGTPATKSQIAKDVVEFLTWTSDQRWEERKIVAMRGVGILAILLALMSHIQRQRWAPIKTRKIFYVPKTKY